MKYLSDYTEKATSDLLEKTGSFFAFSDKQFEEGKKEGVKYISLDMGLIAPEDKAGEVLKGLSNIYELGIKEDLKENTKEGVIKRELVNHEAYYTGDITDTVDSLEGYKITSEEVLEVYNKEKANHYED